LLWCSIAVTRISSPDFNRGRAQAWAIRLMASVVPRTNTTSRAAGAFKKRRTVSRAASSSAVASALSVWTPRWTLALCPR
jgi:hypothetical protein